MKFSIKKLIAATLSATMLFTLAACGNKTVSETNADGKTKLTIGASPAPHAEILEFVKPILKEKGVEIEIKEFTDYFLPNMALDSGDIDANFFQHKPFLDEFNEKNKTDLVSAGAIHFEPLGIYPGKAKSIEELKDGDKIAIPNDPTNEARALQLLASLDLIKLEDGVGLQATPINITENPLNLVFQEIEAAQIPRIIDDVALGVVNGNYAISAGIDESVLTTEDKTSEAAKEFANIIAVKSENAENESIKALVETLQSDDVKAFMEEHYGVTVVPVF